MHVIVRKQHFKGAVPDIPLYPHVSVEALEDTDPFFLSLSLDCSPEIKVRLHAQLPCLGGLWVGHIESEGRLWLKAYIPPGGQRETLRRLKRRGGSLNLQVMVLNDKIDLQLLPGMKPCQPKQHWN